MNVQTKYFSGKTQSVIRLDAAHAKGATYPHININPKVSGIADPHLNIGQVGLQVTETEYHLYPGGSNSMENFL